MPHTGHRLRASPLRENLADFWRDAVTVRCIYSIVVVSLPGMSIGVKIIIYAGRRYKKRQQPAGALAAMRARSLTLIRPFGPPRRARCVQGSCLRKTKGSAVPRSWLTIGAVGSAGILQPLDSRGPWEQIL